MGKYFHTTLKLTQLGFFFLSLLAAKEMQSPSEVQGSPANPREPHSPAGKHLLRERRMPNNLTHHERRSK